MKFVFVYYDEKGKTYCGTDWTWIINDLTTVRGCIARLKKSSVRRNVKTIKLYSTYNVYDENAYTLQRVFTGSLDGLDVNYIGGSFKNWSDSH